MTAVLDGRVPFSSRSLLSIAEEMGQLGLWSRDLSKGTSFWSAGTHRMLGTNPAVDRPSLDTVLKRVHPDDRKMVQDAYELAIQGVVTEHKFRVILTGGRLRWLLSRAEVFYSKDGVPQRIAGLLIDVTDQQNFLQLFRRKDRRSDVLAEQFCFSTWSASKDGAITGFHNWRSFGLQSSSDLMGWRWLRFVRESDRLRAEVVWKQAVAEEKCFVSRMVLSLPLSADEMTVSLYAAPVFDDAGNLSEWTGLVARSMNEAPSVPAIDKMRPPHVRAARALLGWSIEDLSTKSGVSISSIRRFENGDAGSIRRRTILSVKAALEQGGVIFHSRKGDIFLALDQLL